MSYYNTNKESGAALQNSNENARTQEQRIYGFFLMYGQPLSPSMVLEKLKLDCPITSVRRAMTNLTNDEKIIKTDVMVKGLYGKNEHLWRLRTNEDDQDPDQYKLF